MLLLILVVGKCVDVHVLEIGKNWNISVST